MVPNPDQIDRDRSHDRTNSDRRLTRPVESLRTAGERRRLSEPQDQGFAEVARDAKEGLEHQLKTWFKRSRKNTFGVRRPKW